MKSTNTSNLKILSIIHVALIVGQVAFAVIAYFIVESTFVFIGGFEDPFIFVVPSIFLFSISGGKMIYQKLLATSFEKESLTDKLNILRVAVIVRFAISEATTIIAIVAYFATYNFLYIILASLMVVFFISLKPKKEKIEIDLKIDYKMKSEFDAAMGQ